MLVQFLIAFAIIVIIGRWKFYKKAGIDGWKSIIPFYNDFVLVNEIAGMNWFWVFIFWGTTILSAKFGTLVTILNLPGNSLVAYNISKKMNKDTGWIVATTIFSNLIYCIEGFSKKSNYDNSVAVTENSYFDKK